MEASPWRGRGSCSLPAVEQPPQLRAATRVSAIARGSPDVGGSACRGRIHLATCLRFRRERWLGFPACWKGRPPEDQDRSARRIQAATACRALPRPGLRRLCWGAGATTRHPSPSCLATVIEAPRSPARGSRLEQSRRVRRAVPDPVSPRPALSTARRAAPARPPGRSRTPARGPAARRAAATRAGGACREPPRELDCRFPTESPPEKPVREAVRAPGSVDRLAARPGFGRRHPRRERSGHPREDVHRPAAEARPCPSGASRLARPLGCCCCYTSTGSPKSSRRLAAMSLSGRSPHRRSRTSRPFSTREALA